jgi:large subunit ribosomal protein L25
MTANPFELVVEKRDVLGKGASRRLRRIDDKVPGILYGGEKAPDPILIEQKCLLKALENEAFYSHILTIKMDGAEQKALLRDLQRHPYKRRILHFDLLRVSGKEKIHMQVPLHFLGEDIAPAVKIDKGIISHLMNQIEIRCLPDDLPEFIEVDASSLELDKTIHLSQLKLPKGVEFATAVPAGTERDLPVVSAHLPRVNLAPEDTGAPVAPEAPEAIKQAGPESNEEEGKK